MHAAFTRMQERLLHHIGQESFLRDEIVTPSRKIAIQHGVKLEGYGHGTVASNGDLVVVKSVATIPNTYEPLVNDKVEHPDGTFYLDVLISNNGITSQFALRATP